MVNIFFVHVFALMKKLFLAYCFRGFNPLPSYWSDPPKKLIFCVSFLRWNAIFLPAMYYYFRAWLFLTRLDVMSQIIFVCHSVFANRKIRTHAINYGIICWFCANRQIIAHTINCVCANRQIDAHSFMYTKIKFQAPEVGLFCYFLFKA